MATFHRYGVGHYACTAVLVSPRWLLTAAHCKINTSDLAVVGGGSYQTGARIGIEKVFNFKQTFYGDFDRDIGLVLLKRKAPYGSSFAILNEDKVLPLSGAYARVIGYGRTSFNGAGKLGGAGILRSVDVPIVKQGVCRWAFHADLDLTSDMVCAGKKGCDACLGDSGGPLVQYNEKGRMVVVGIVSAGILCGSGFYPGIYMRVASFLRGIRSFGVEFDVGSGVQLGEDGQRMQRQSSGKRRRGSWKAGVGGEGGKTVGITERSKRGGRGAAKEAGFEMKEGGVMVGGSARVGGVVTAGRSFESGLVLVLIACLAALLVNTIRVGLVGSGMS